MIPIKTMHKSYCLTKRGTKARNCKKDLRRKRSGEGLGGRGREGEEREVGKTYTRAK